MLQARASDASGSSCSTAASERSTTAPGATNRHSVVYWN